MSTVKVDINTPEGALKYLELMARNSPATGTIQQATAQMADIMKACDVIARALTQKGETEKNETN